MSQFWALMWTIKKGSEQAVEDLFRNYGRPEHVIRDHAGNEKGRLLATQVFIKDNVVVRVVEFEGDIRDLAPHMGRQPAVRQLEQQLDPYLETPRDMSTPEGAREFFQRTAMRCIIARKEGV